MLTKIFPNRLEKNKKIGIFASASPAMSNLSIDLSYTYLKSKGLDIFEHPQCRIKVGHTAGTIQERVSAFHEMLIDESVGMLMAYWGGTNTNDLLPYLDYELIKKNPKIIIGFSDTTALLQSVTNMTGLVTFMGPAAITFIKPEVFEYSWEYFQKICINPTDSLIIEDSPTFADDEYFLREDNDHRIIQQNTGRRVFRHGEFQGEIVASNLETLLALAGTQYFPDLTNKALFVEESEEENISTINRNFRHLSQIINMTSLGALCIGRFCSKSSFTEHDSVSMLLENIVEDTDIPVLYNLDFGHSDPLFTIPNGGTVRVNTQTQELTLLQSVR